MISTATINRLLSCGYTLEIERELSQCSITVKDKYKNIGITQMLPIDGHIDYSLDKCVNFCINKLLKTLKDYDKETIGIEM